MKLTLLGFHHELLQLNYLPRRVNFLKQYMAINYFPFIILQYHPSLKQDPVILKVRRVEASRI
jgi:hypothetical protein